MHTHAFPKKIAAKAMSTLSDRIGFEPHYDGSLEGLKAYEKAGGAEGFLLLPIATNPASVPSIPKSSGGFRNPDGQTAWPIRARTTVRDPGSGSKLFSFYEIFIADHGRELSHVSWKHGKTLDFRLN